MKHSILYLICIWIGIPVSVPAQTASDTSGQPYTDITVGEFEALMQQDSVIILDVRTPKETSAGMIAGAIGIDVLAQDFADRINMADTNRTYLVYCRSGHRSVRACEILAALGFNSLYNLKGGYTAWRKQDRGH